MKKYNLQIITLIALILVWIATGCAPVQQIFEPHRQNGHRTGTPRYGRNDKIKISPHGLKRRGVINYYIVDTAFYAGQWFYNCHNEMGQQFTRIPENSIDN